MKSASFFRVAFPCWLAGVLACLLPVAARAEDRLWTSRGPAGASNITGVALDSTDPRVLYAASTGGEPGSTGIRKSVDGGQTWLELGAGDPALSAITCVAVDPENPSSVYVGTAQGLVAVSLDAGATWTKVTVGSGVVSAIAIEPATGSVYASVREPETCFSVTTPVSRSTDGGATWSVTSLGQSSGVYALLADPHSQTLFGGTNFFWYPDFTGFGCSGGVGGGVAQTRSAGASWEVPATDLKFAVTALAADLRGGILAAAESGQIFRSGDSGGTWTPLGKLPGAVSAIASDPSAASTLYAGLSNGGVWRSGDGGSTWRPFDSGLGSRSVRSLAIDPAGRNLYAGTQGGVFHRDLPAAIAGSCQPGGDHLCLLGSRFRVDLHAIDPRTKAEAPPTALANGDRFGYFSFPTLTGDPSLPEVLVKMLDASSLPGGAHWFFSSSLTNIPYSLVVTDTTNGQVQIYDGQAFCGTADARAFPDHAFQAASREGGETGEAPATTGSELAVLSGRFRIALSASDPRTGTAVAGTAIPGGNRFGYFSLPALTGDPTFPEVFVKMLDARALENGDFWIFQGGMTTLPYELTVMDSVTGLVKTFRNDPRDPTQLCGSADLRVTTGPTPTPLTGEWAGTWESYGITTTVSQSGDRVVIRGVAGLSEGDSSDLHFVGVLRGGILNGVLQSEAGYFRTCHYEGAAIGTATASRIQLTSEHLDGTCGQYLASFPLVLTRVSD